MHFYTVISNSLDGRWGIECRFHHLAECMDELRNAVGQLQDMRFDSKIEPCGSTVMVACLEIHPVERKVRVRYYADCEFPGKSTRGGRVLLDITQQPLDISDNNFYVELFLAGAEDASTIRRVCRNALKKAGAVPRPFPIM